MVARPAEPRYSANAGELDRALAGRLDIRQYYSGGLRFKHVEPVPQSGFQYMGGTVDNGPVRARLEELALSGTSATPGPHTGTATIWSGNVTGDVAAVHIAALSANTGTHSAFCEVYAGGQWIQIGSALGFSTEAIQRTFAVAPGAGIAGVSQVRIRATFSASATANATGIKVLSETGTQDRPRYESLRHDSGDRYFLSVTEKWLDIFLDDQFVAGVYLSDIDTDRLPELGFYAENATIGIFHRTMSENIRVRRAGSASEWLVDGWPIENVPRVDLGGVYPKTADKWTITVRYARTGDSSPIYIHMGLSVDGEDTPTIVGVDALGNRAREIDIDWPTVASNVANAINDLPSIGGGVTCSSEVFTHTFEEGYFELTITFGGSSSGNEYQIDAQILSDSRVSALSAHLEIGETEYEPIFSASRGSFGGAALVQDRLGYFDMNAEQSALALSRPAEYFDLNIEGAGDNRARLDKLRGGESAERVLAVYDSTYLLLFTDQSVYFAPNRTIKAGEPLNFTLTAATGIVPYTEPTELEKKIYYIGYNDDDEDLDGHQILSLSYDELLTSFDPVPESLLASHLVKGVMRTKRQRSAADSDASKMWAMRRDGRLVAAQVIKSEEILGLCEWISPAGGLVREIEVDARNRLRLCVERDGMLRHERHDRAALLHAIIETTCDLAGQVDGLAVHEGRQVWAVAEGYVLGPFTVAAGKINMGDAFQGSVKVGLWNPPIFESMPFYRVLRDDSIIERPGRIPVVHLNLIETTSVAVGANGLEPRDVQLLNAADPADHPMPPKTGKFTVAGLLGSKVGTTVVITQTKPGRLRVRDYKVEEAL